MQGRLLGFVEHPFECATNYAGAAAMRCNLDVQDLRRVLPAEHWLADEEDYPSLGERPSRGYMQQYEWDGQDYVQRHRSSTPSPVPVAWKDEIPFTEWRALLLKLMRQRVGASQ